MQLHHRGKKNMALLILLFSLPLVASNLLRLLNTKEELLDKATLHMQIYISGDDSSPLSP